MTISVFERIAEARKAYPEDRYDLVFDESGEITAATPKIKVSSALADGTLSIGQISEAQWQQPLKDDVFRAWVKRQERT